MSAAGKPACPVACKYCSVTEVSYRKEQWAKSGSISINKVVTILNRSCSDWLPPERFTSDILCFEASSDPFWMDRFGDFTSFCKVYAPVARLVTFVTKMPISRKHLDILKSVKTPVAVVVSVTGLERLGIEKTRRKVLYDNIKKCQDASIPVIPLIHPYIHGLADAKELVEEFKSLGMKYYQIKGFRFDRSMTWLPPDIYRFYMDKEGMEYMPEVDIEVDGITRLELGEFYRMYRLPPKIDYQLAREYVEDVMRHAIVTSSSSKDEVMEHAVRRRLVQ